MDKRERFMGHVDASGECWEWLGWKDARGYGKATSDIKPRAKDWAHRVAYRLFVGPIPDGLPLDHTCRNVSCVRPEHLEPVTRAENIRRAWPERTSCPQGHSLDDAYTERTRHGKVAKRCRTCHLARVNARRLRVGSTD